MEATMLESLVCPITRTRLHVEGEWLVSETGIKYPIENGIPRLLPQAAVMPEGRMPAEGSVG